MLHRPDEFAAFVQEPPTIEISGGVALVRYRTGTLCAERAMSIPNLARAVDRAQRALKRHAAGEEIVIVDD